MCADRPTRWDLWKARPRLGMLVRGKGNDCLCCVRFDLWRLMLATRTFAVLLTTTMMMTTTRTRMVVQDDGKKSKRW